MDDLVLHYRDVLDAFDLDRVHLVGFSLGGWIAAEFAVDWGAMPQWMVHKNLEMLAEEVIPHFRGPEGKPVWALEDRPAPHTRTEFAATVGKPETRPLVRMDGIDGHVDSSTAHVPELRTEVVRDIP